MNRSDVIDELESLMKLDYDAARSYEQAMDEIDVAAIRDQIAQFRDDHERHVSNISALIRNLGQQPPERSRDIKGFLIEGFTAVRSATGTEGALKALRSNEKITNRNYSRALEKEFPMEVRDQIESNYEDERAHLQYIEQAINGRIWEPSETRMG